jgi:hypothetical protein
MVRKLKVQNFVTVLHTKPYKDQAPKAKVGYWVVSLRKER